MPKLMEIEERDAVGTSQVLSADIIVVGGGMAGATAATVLSRKGWRITLVEPRQTCPPLFRAEKIEPDQVELFRKLGLLEYILPHAVRVEAVHKAYNGRLFDREPMEQYAMAYGDMVNILREKIPAGVEFKLDRVDQITNSDNVQRVKLASGQELTSRLIVLACGGSSQLQASLGLRRNVICKDQSVTLGFSIVRKDGQPFPFPAVTYFPATAAKYIDYLTLFPFADTMRANLFVFCSVNEPWIREFIKEPAKLLEQAFPKLSHLIGEFNIVTKVETGRVDIYRMEGELKPGVVLIGDAFQSPCPSTGQGLSKILTDVVILSERVQHWFASPKLGADKIAAFYNDPGKQAADSRALDGASYRRRAVTDQSIRWRFHRLRLHFEMMLRKRSWPR